MGDVPGFFIGIGPGNPDTDGVILAALGQVVADYQEDHSHKDKHQAGHGKLHTQRQSVHGKAAEIGQYRHNPQHHLEWLGVSFPGLGIKGGNQHQQPLDGQHGQRHAENGKGKAAPSVRLTVNTPMGDQFLRQPIPQDKADQNRQQRNQGRENQNFSIFANHTLPPSGARAGSAAASGQRRESLRRIQMEITAIIVMQV